MESRSGKSNCYYITIPFFTSSRTTSLRRSLTQAKRQCIKCSKQGSIPLYDFNFIPILHCIHALLIIKRVKKSPRQLTQCSQSCTTDILYIYTGIYIFNASLVKNCQVLRFRRLYSHHHQRIK